MDAFHELQMWRQAAGRIALSWNCWIVPALRRFSIYKLTHTPTVQVAATYTRKHETLPMIYIWLYQHVRYYIYTRYDFQAYSCDTISSLDGANGALPWSNLNHVNHLKLFTGSYDKFRSRAVLQSVLSVDAAVPCFILKTYVNERDRDSALRLYDGVTRDSCSS